MGFQKTGFLFIYFSGEGKKKNQQIREQCSKAQTASIFFACLILIAQVLETAMEKNRQYTTKLLGNFSIYKHTMLQKGDTSTF